MVGSIHAFRTLILSISGIFCLPRMRFGVFCLPRVTFVESRLLCDLRVEGFKAGVIA